MTPTPQCVNVEDYSLMYYPVFKKLLPLLILLGVCAFFFSFTPAAYAATIGETTSNVAQGAADVAGEATKAAANFVCGGENGLGSCIQNVLAFIGIIALNIGILLLGVMAGLFDFSLFISFHMGTWIGKGAPLGVAVQLGWTVFRDLGNLVFIAGLVWASIAMILQTNALGTTPGKLIVNIIVAAVLVNFSFFFTGVLIDASNILSREVYQTGIKGTEVKLAPIFESYKGPFASTLTDIAGTETSLAGLFLQQTQLSSIFSENIFNEGAERDSQFLLLLFMSIMLVFLTARIFFSVFVAVLVRFIILVLLLISSPVMVLSIIDIGPLKSWGQQWWKALTSQLVFLPVFLILLMLSFNVIGAAVKQWAAVGVGYTDIFSDPGAVVSVIFVFALAWGMLRISLLAAQSLSQGRSVQLPGVETLQGPAGKFGTSLGGFVVGAPKNLALWALRKPLQGDRIARGVKGAVVGGARAVQEGYKDIDAQLGRTPLGILPGEDYATRQAQKDARERRKAAINDVLNKYKNDTKKITESDDRKAIRDWADSRSDKEIADFLKGRSPDERERIIESLPADRQAAIRDAAKGKTKPKNESGSSEGSDKKSAGNNQPGGQQGTAASASFATSNRTDQLLSQLLSEERRGNILQNRANTQQMREMIRERRADWQELLADKRGFSEVSKKVADLGKLISKDMVLGDDRVARNMTGAELAVFPDQPGITKQDLAAVAKQLERVGNKSSLDSARSNPRGSIAWAPLNNEGGI